MKRNFLVAILCTVLVLSLFPAASARANILVLSAEELNGKTVQVLDFDKDNMVTLVTEGLTYQVYVKALQYRKPYVSSVELTYLSWADPLLVPGEEVPLFTGVWWSVQDYAEVRQVYEPTERDIEVDRRFRSMYYGYDILNSFYADSPTTRCIFMVDSPLWADLWLTIPAFFELHEFCYQTPAESSEYGTGEVLGKVSFNLPVTGERLEMQTFSGGLPFLASGTQKVYEHTPPHIIYPGLAYIRVEKIGGVAHARYISVHDGQQYVVPLPEKEPCVCVLSESEGGSYPCMEFVLWDNILEVEPTPTVTPTYTLTPTATDVPTPTLTPSPHPTVTATATITPVPSAATAESYGPTDPGQEENGPGQLNWWEQFWESIQFLLFPAGTVLVLVLAGFAVYVRWHQAHHQNQSRHATR